MEKLPTEVLTYILGFLDVRDLLKCSELNQFWYDITNTDYVWKRFCKGSEYLKEFQEQDTTSGSSDELRTLKPMCYWKEYFFNYGRITGNWMKKKFKKYEVPMSGLYGTYKMAAYDGATLVLCYTTGFRVFKVDKRNLNDVQTSLINEGMLVFLNSVYTNTSYIVLNCGKVVTVYKLIEDRYQGVSMFYKNHNSQRLEHSNVKEDIFVKKVVKPFFNGEICSISSVIQTETLYIYVQRIIYIWDLEKMECLKEIPALSFLVAQDKFNLFICPDNLLISGYHSNDSQPFITFETDWKISQIEINTNVLIAIEEDHVMGIEDTNRKLCAWHKNSGDKLYEINLYLPDSCFLHPRMNILLGNVTSGENICAISPKNNRLLWVRFTRRQESPFLNYLFEIGFRNLAAARFIIASLDAAPCYHLIDSLNGKTLYLLENIEIKYVALDLLLHSDSFRKNIIIRIYS